MVCMRQSNENARILGEAGVRIVGPHRDGTIWRERCQVGENDRNTDFAERYQRTSWDRVLTGPEEFLRFYWARKAVWNGGEIRVGRRPGGRTGGVGTVPGDGRCGTRRKLPVRSEFQSARRSRAEQRVCGGHEPDAGGGAHFNLRNAAWFTGHARRKETVLRVHDG